MGHFNGTDVSWIRLAFFGCLLTAAMASEPRLRAQETPVTSVERMLLLQSGKIVKGVIRQSAAGYTVNVTGGQLVLPFDQVRLEGADLEDIYRQQRDTLPDRMST